MPSREAGPLLTFEWRGRQLGKQPPIVGDYCIHESCGSGCMGLRFDCSRCRGRFCASHYRSHKRAYVVPRDSWRTTRRNVRKRSGQFLERHGSPAYQALRYVLGSYCKTPGGRRVASECGYESTACTPEVLGCLRCKFTYCTKHFHGHAVQYAWPRSVLLRIHAQYVRQLDEINARRRRLLRIHVPQLGEWR